MKELNTGDSRSSCSVQNNFASTNFSLGYDARIDKPSKCNNSRTVLIIMKNWNWHEFFKTLLNQEAIRCLYIFKIDSTKRGG